MRERRSGHDPGRLVRDLAVMLADGGEALTDLGAIREQAPLLGEVRLGCDRLPGDRADRPATPSSSRACGRRARGPASTLGSSASLPSG
jgi:hypothetical protein